MSIVVVACNPHARSSRSTRRIRVHSVDSHIDASRCGGNVPIVLGDWLANVSSNCQHNAHTIGPFNAY